ncbi:hypothetical protein CK203_060073 [Vitis vinifera]|uniref:Plastocyanin-like domain-containing protein n=1 Tax=Vitis vinifera TaxID=29760 RepID=A0A438GK41_VITVI|nr:hypothetical protein CK203_060073 [Vitis vinifera]
MRLAPLPLVLDPPFLFFFHHHHHHPPSGPTAFDTSVIGTILHDFMEIVFQNNETTLQSWHLDGYTFWTVGFGSNQWMLDMRGATIWLMLIVDTLSSYEGVTVCKKKKIGILFKTAYRNFGSSKIMPLILSGSDIVAMARTGSEKNHRPPSPLPAHIMHHNSSASTTMPTVTHVTPPPLFSYQPRHRPPIRRRAAATTMPSSLFIS